MTNFITGPTNNFHCLVCGKTIGVYPETARIQPLCSRCSKRDLPVHVGWRNSQK